MRRPLIILLVVVTAVAVAFGWFQWTISAKPRHVVLIVLDTVRSDGLGCYGHPLDPTPNIDALAEDGVRFDQAIAASGWTLPAVASLFTGAWPTIHGAVGRSFSLTPIRGELPTAAEILSGVGFQTFGFANAAFISPTLHLDRGFDVFDYDFTHMSQTRRADATVDAAVKTMRENGDGKSFVMLHLFDPHLDYDPPGNHAARYTGGRVEPELPLSIDVCLGLQRRSGLDPPSDEDVAYVRGVYQGEISFVDEQVGRVIAELKAAGVYDETMVIVVSDHGEEFWDHGGFEHGHTLYDELIRVPMIIKFPRDRHKGTTVASQVRVLDVMPTVFDVLGVRSPDSFEGQSLLPVVKGKESGNRPAFSESTLYGAYQISWRTGGYKYIHSLGGEAEGELYDLLADTNESENLFRVRPAVAAKMRHDLLKFYGQLEARAATMSALPEVPKGPETIKKMKSLGYIR